MLTNSLERKGKMPETTETEQDKARIRQVVEASRAMDDRIMAWAVANLDDLKLAELRKLVDQAFRANSELRMYVRGFKDAKPSHVLPHAAPDWHDVVEPRISRLMDVAVFLEEILDDAKVMDLKRTTAPFEKGGPDAEKTS